MKTLLVVSGGDAPGINTVIARYIALAQAAGDTVIGADGGFAGLLAGRVHPLSLTQVFHLSGRGGSILRSSRDPVLANNDAQSQLTRIMAQHALDNLLLFGGDGTLRHVLPRLHEWGIPTMALPTTIDNDVAGTERTLGFDSACNYAYQAVNGALTTGHALSGRIFMIETLGGDTGYLALAVALGAGAHAALLPEYDFDDEWLAHA